MYGAQVPKLEATKRREPEPRGVKPTRKQRQEAEKLVVQAVSALFGHELEKLSGMLSQSVCVFWGDGQSGWYEREPLLQALKAQAVEHITFSPTQVRSYTLSEQRLLFPLGVPDLLNRIFEARRGLLVGMSVGELGPERISMAVRFNQDGPVISSLVFPGLDQALVRSAKASFSEQDAVRAADKIIRHWLLGHGQQLRSLRNWMMHRVYRGETPVQTERLLNSLEDDEEPRPGAIDLIFHKPRVTEQRQLAEALGAPLYKQIMRASKGLWFKELEALRPKAVTVETELWGQEQKGPSVTALFLRVIERQKGGQEPERWRLGGLF